MEKKTNLQTLTEPVDKITYNNKNSNGRIGSRQFNLININDSAPRYHGQIFTDSSQYSRNENRSMFDPNKTYSQALQNTYSNITDDINGNNIGVFGNNDINNFNSLVSEIRKLKQLVDMDNMLSVIRNLNIKLVNCRDGFEKLQAFIEAADFIK